MTAPVQHSARAALRSPRAAAVAGILFSVLLTVSVVLIRLAVGGQADGAGDWVVDDSKRRTMGVALSLFPYAGIAFLWFIGVVRDLIGAGEDRLFATVFLGSGLLFVAMLFASGAVTAGLLDVSTDVTETESDEVWTFGRGITTTVLMVYAMRMAAVFTLSTTTLAVRLGIMPRWLVVLGYGTALVMLVSVGRLPWVELAFPAWVFAFSVHILIVTLHRHREGGPRGADASAATT